MKKIWLITPNYPPEIGACAYRIAYLAEKLAAAGYQVEVIAPYPSYPEGKMAAHFKTKGWHEQIHINSNLSVFRYKTFICPTKNIALRFFVLLFNFWVLSFWLFFLKKKSRPAQIWLQSPPFPTAMGVALWANFWKIPYVLNLSDLYPQVLVDLEILKKEGFLHQILRRGEKKMYQQAIFCIGQSREILQQIRWLAPEKEAILYRTGVDVHFFRPKKRYDTTHKFKIVYAGLLGLVQGLAELIEAIDWEKNQVELHIYGGGLEKSKIKKLAQRFPAAIFCYPALPQKEIATILADYDAALISQKQYVYGTVPSKIYEALAVGLPILLCGVGEAADILEKTGTGLVSKPKHYEGLLQNIIKIKEMSPQMRKKMGRRGQKIAQKYFTKQKQWSRLYRYLKTKD
ncbi:glycosyltransferase family 4 protein [Hugenholtzia roseola]|uniref:glycosyltransferase family 4 protein n=1 Tax=Hugenholtzia roseola TaxID=1002 RepID=UPI000414791C|nr:glycosyltransferase family 4 protein [Hugenholtzia roseola]